uniref:Uncharacterized protein n=1 Tax=Rhizophagus irregularis (strain DAOM 181602 / DAOM 197198 / MUCL 43194) TaxID=747089 RepID=U9UNF4_RHIID
MNLLVWTQAMEDGISGDHVDPLSNLSLKENEELLAINDIGGLLELLDELTSLKALLNKSVHGMYKILSRNLGEHCSLKSPSYCSKKDFIDPVVVLQHSMSSLARNERRASIGP